MEGYIGGKIAGENGFGYDPIFAWKKYGCTTAELSEEQKNEISHRGKALRHERETCKGKPMKILIISDTHRKHENLLKVLEQECPVDLLIHLGDAEGMRIILQSRQAVLWKWWRGITTFFLTATGKRAADWKV